ncbi:MAG TPA: SRPBCC family protein [Methyloceanibacter sp.]|jgi:hypothetical protein|nr:SRPBCC family protein [Methyloceanibacter sp.]
MRPVMRLALGLVVLALVFVAVAFALPNQITVSRSVVINAPEAVVFPYLNNLHAFKDWSPWAERDPNVRVSYSGPETGKGASLSWASEQASVGRGSMQIAESDPNRRIDLAVDYNGLEGTAFYTIAPAGSGSKVTWGFGHETGTSPIKRWRGLMLDGFVGSEYQVGLENLKEKIEGERRPTAPAATLPQAVPPAGSDAPPRAGLPPAEPAPAAEAPPPPEQKKPQRKR